ncbi:MAG: oligosaccharide flippase family protein [Sphingobacterium sp.]
MIKNDEVKKLLSNFLSLSSIQLINLILPLVTLPYLITVIGLEKYGVVIMATSLITYFYTICDYSFKITGTRDVVIHRSSVKRLSVVFSKITYIKTALLIVSIIIIALSVIFYRGFREHYIVYVFAVINLVGNAYYPDWFFQGIEKMKFIAISNVFIKILFTVLVFIFIKTENDYWMYPMFFSFGFVISTIAAYFFLYKIYKLKFVPIKKKTLFGTVKSSFPIFVNQFLPNMYNNTSGFLLGLLVGNYLLGIYDAVKKIIELFNVLMGTISRVFFPFLTRKKAAFATYMKLSVLLSVILAIIPILYNNLIMNFLNINYDHSLLLIIILSTGLIFIGLYNVFGLNYFIVHRKDKIVMKNTIVSSIIGLVLCYPMIHFFGIMGAALNLTISRICMGGGLTLKYYRLKNEI